MKIKLSKKTWGIIGGVGAVVVAAAVAIPVGIVYGTKSDSVTSDTTRLDFTTDTSQLQTFKYGDDTSKAPALPEGKGFIAADYEVSKATLVETNISFTASTTDTKPNAENLHVTYEYPSVDGSKKLRIVYPAALTKAAAPEKMDPATVAKARDAKKHIYGQAYSFDFSAVLKSSFVGYFAAPAAPVYMTTDGAPTSLDVSAINSLPAGKVFTATYQATLDTEYADDNSFRSGTYVVT